MEAMVDSSSKETRQSGRLMDYLAIARLDHSVKHVLIVPGLVLAWQLRGFRSERLCIP